MQGAVFCDGGFWDLLLGSFCVVSRVTDCFSEGKGVIELRTLTEKCVFAVFVLVDKLKGQRGCLFSRHVWISMIDQIVVAAFRTHLQNGYPLAFCVLLLLLLLRVFFQWLCV